MNPAPLDTRLPVPKSPPDKTIELRAAAFALALYVLITACTTAYFAGDATDYAASILSHEQFWDFGHLLWRPLGWLAYKMCRPLITHPGSYERVSVLRVLGGLNWLAGAGCTLLLYRLLTRISQSWTAYVVLVFFICSQAFLNYAQTGNAYIPGLALLLLGFYFAVRSGEQKDAWFDIASGLALAGAVCFWLPYLFALPAALTAPYFLTDCGPTQRKRTLRAIVVFTLATIGIYGSVILGLGLHSMAAIHAWVATSSHGIPPSPGVLRMAFGLARSFINLGNDGVLFKRFLIHDPYNHVSLSDLLRASLWKLLFFYLFTATLVINLARTTESRKMLGLFALNALPVVFFATLWQGGDMERYLAFYPTFFLAIAALLSQPQKSRWSQGITLIFITTTFITNFSVLNKLTINRQQQVSAARLIPLQPHLKPASIIVVINPQDDLVNFNRSYPFNPLNQDKRIHLRALVSIGTDETPRWRQVFAAKALVAWNHGGDVWLSRRLLASRPRATWNWVEGDDKRLAWRDLYRFFVSFEKSETVGGEDGFVLLKESPHNRQLLPVPTVQDKQEV